MTMPIENKNVEKDRLPLSVDQDEEILASLLDQAIAICKEVEEQDTDGESNSFGKDRTDDAHSSPAQWKLLRILTYYKKLL